MELRVGVLALQGSFREHASQLKRIPGVLPVEVRTVKDLESVAGLIIPGGESTTMALIAERWGLIPALQAFAAANQPIWGTCAGLIFLADRATGQKQGGQALLGGLDCMVHRNFFGSQIDSFETTLPAPKCLPCDGIHEGPFRAVFIRAPAISEAGPGVEVLTEYRLSEEESQEANGLKSVIVAVRSNNILATAFHPELTDDPRWHALFVEMIKRHLSQQQGGAASIVGNGESHKIGRPPNRPADLPVYV